MNFNVETRFIKDEKGLLSISRISDSKFQISDFKR
jgi:hypothetical protein